MIQASMRPATQCLLLGVVLAACGQATPAGDSGLGAFAPPRGAAITAPRNAWTWLPIDGAVCDDGSPTGIGVFPTDSPNLLVYLEGGGACWDYSTCFVVNTSTHGPFADAEFARFTTGIGASSDNVFSDADGATFKGWSKVYIPYCTGDIHGGDNVITYSNGGGKTGTVHHKGWNNISLALGRLGTTFPSPDKLVWTGASAGGYGSAVNYVQARATWPRARAYLIDDSGPVFVDAGISDFLKSAWGPSWNLPATLFKLCPDCAGGDWSLAYTALERFAPTDRMALLSSEQDKTISTYLLLMPALFQQYLNQLATMRFDPSPNLRYFFQSGDSHTMLGDESRHVTGSVTVASWIDAMVSDNSGWGSVKP
jgi:hypothetical protein